MPERTPQPLGRRPRRAPADLLLSLGRLGPDPLTLQRIAGLLGYRASATQYERAASQSALPTPPAHVGRQDQRLVAPTRQSLSSSLEPLDVEASASPATIPTWLDEVAPLPPEDTRTLLWQEPESLFDPPRSRALLTAAAAVDRRHGEIDLPRLVELHCRGALPDEVPRRAVAGLGSRVQLLIDAGDSLQCFSSDIARLISDLARQVGDDRLEIAWFHGCPELGTFAADGDDRTPHVAPHHGAVLIVTDLGLASPRAPEGAARPRDWVRFAKRLAASACPLTLILPLAKHRLPVALAKYARLLRWDRDASVRAIRRRPAASRPRVAQPDDVTPELTHGARLLAERACLAARIEPSLLRALRLMAPALDVAAESELYWSDLVEVRSSAGLRLRHDKLNWLREQLRAQPKLFEACWRVTADSHRHSARAIRYEEELTYLTLGGLADADARARARSILRELVSTIHREGIERLAFWGERALVRMPPELVESMEEARMLYAGIARSGGAQSDEYAWLDVPSVAEGQTYVRMVTGGIEFVPTPLTDSHELRLPAVSHPLVQLRWQEQQRVVSIDRARTTFVELDASELILQPLGAARYRLRRNNDTRAHIVIAFAPSDQPSAIRLWRDLHEAGLSSSLTALGDGFDLEGAHHLVALFTPTGWSDASVRELLRSARRRGVQLALVTMVAPNTAEMPRWLRDSRWYELSNTWDRLALTRELAKPPSVRPVPFLAPPMETPVDYHQHKLQDLKRMLINDAGTALSTTVSLTGHGGSGKTTLAAAICHDDDIIDAFDGGILWVSEDSRFDTVGTLAELASALTGTRQRAETLEDAQRILEAAVDHRRCMLVIDDVRDADQLDVFLRAPAFRNAARLLTTRDATLLPSEGLVVELNVDEATVLLPDPSGPWQRWLAAGEATAPTGADDWAVIVSAEYADVGPQVAASLHECTRTAEAFYRWVTSHPGGGVPREHIVLLQTLSKEVIASVENIKRLASASNARAPGRLYLFFSGISVEPMSDELGLMLSDVADAGPPSVMGLRGFAIWCAKSAVFDEVVLLADTVRSPRLHPEFYIWNLEERVEPPPVGAAVGLTVTRPATGSERENLGTALIAGLGSAMDAVTGQVTSRSWLDYMSHTASAERWSFEWGHGGDTLILTEFPTRLTPVRFWLPQWEEGSELVVFDSLNRTVARGKVHTPSATRALPFGRYQARISDGPLQDFVVDVEPVDVSMPSTYVGGSGKTGTVKWFHVERGFGFITPDGGGADIFVHISDIERAGYRTLSEGMRVSFHLAITGQKLHAQNIRVI